jgi:hypothetical protein
MHQLGYLVVYSPTKLDNHWRFPDICIVGVAVVYKNYSEAICLK